MNEAIDTIDAAVFSGDTFENTEARSKFRTFLKRWEAELDRIADSQTDEEDTTDPPAPVGHDCC